MTVTTVANDGAMLEYGNKVSNEISVGQVVFLIGELGAGKTTLVKGILSGFGYKGHVTSPTYTLVEPYTLQGLNVYHLDLYQNQGSE